MAPQAKMPDCALLAGRVSEIKAGGKQWWVSAKDILVDFSRRIYARNSATVYDGPMTHQGCVQIRRDACGHLQIGQILRKGYEWRKRHVAGGYSRVYGCAQIDCC